MPIQNFAPNVIPQSKKNGGCLHMTCEVCSNEFCWSCGSQWAEHDGESFLCNATGERLNQDE